jgi:acetolactate synthase-1/2/3 large subunit
MATSVGERLASIIAGGGVEAMFGVPGGQTLPIYGAAPGAGLQHVLMRDERSAACAADAYARLSGRVGFCDATVGPGVTNLVSGLAEAYGSSIPLVAVIADIRSDRSELRRRGNASQALDQGPLLAPITKWIGRVERVENLEAVLDQALRVATSGRPGPVVLEIPDDVFADSLPEGAPRRAFGPAAFGYPRFRPAPAAADIEEAAQLIAGASRPLVLAGGGVTFSDASEAVRALAEAHQLPVATTISGKGTIDERSPLAAGVTGTFGTRRGAAAMLAADVVALLGTKLGQLTTFGWQLPSASQTVIHVDVDGEEIGRTGEVAVGIVADAREAANALSDALSALDHRGRNWLEELDAVGGAPQQPRGGSVAPHLLAAALSDALREDDVLVCDASLASGWGAAFAPVRQPRSFIAPRGLAGIGWGGGGVIGARLAVPEHRRVVLLVGDGAWGYSLSEMETAARLGLDITYVVLNNASLAWIQHIEQRREHDLQSVFSDVDFAGVARAMGGEADRVTNLEDFEARLDVALNTPRPYLLDVVSSPEASPILALETMQPGRSDAYD